MAMEKFSGLKGKAFLFLIFFWSLWFINFSGRTIFAPVMPLIEDEFVISHARASSLFAFTSFGYACSVFLSGIFSGLLGYKRSIIVSLAISACIFFAIPHVRVFNVLVFLSFILGISIGIYIPSVIPLITEYYEERTWGRVIAVHETGASMSIFTSPLVAIFLLQYFTWREMFYVVGAFFVIPAIIFSFAGKEVKVQPTKKGFFSSLMKNRHLWMLGTIWVFAAGACLGLYFVLPLYLTKELGIDIRHANTIFSISRLGGIFVSILIGFIVDKFSLRKTIFLVVFVTGILTMLIAVKNIRSIEVFLFLQASISTAFFPVGLVSISKMFDREKRGMATGLIVTLGVAFGLGIVPYLIGLAGDYISFRLGIMIFGILVMLSSGLTYFMKELK
jgi:NNP family nitrate/nitrite transporter-like MFS transporter